MRAGATAPQSVSGLYMKGERLIHGYLYIKYTPLPRKWSTDAVLDDWRYAWSGQSAARPCGQRFHHLSFLRPLVAYNWWMHSGYAPVA